MRIATPQEIRTWDQLVVANPDGGHTLQSRAFGEFKAMHGWRVHYLIHEMSSSPVAVLFLSRKIPGFGELWYSPKGPGVTTPADVASVVRDHALLTNAFLVKVEPEIAQSSATDPAWHSAGLQKSQADIQISRATIIVDLHRDEDALLASFKPKCRYNIRLAARKGVRVEPVPLTDANLATMYDLMAATQARAQFPLRSRRYFYDFWRLHEASSQGQLFFAYKNDEVLAGAFITFLGKKAWYKDGGSFKVQTELMAPYVLQWEIMRWLQARGIDSYDLVAVPPQKELTPEHPLYGLYRFKSGFSETITEFVGTYDLPLSPRKYAVWERVGERIAHRYSQRVRRDLFY